MSKGPKEGDVWDYPYLWARQDQAGETEGRKNRPAAIPVLVERRDGRHWMALLAITTQPPGTIRHALPVPEIERRRSGLSGDGPSWIILDEHNVDIVEQSYYLDSEARLGAFSPRFRKMVQKAFAKALRDRKSNTVRRMDE